MLLEGTIFCQTREGICLLPTTGLLSVEPAIIKRSFTLLIHLSYGQHQSVLNIISKCAVGNTYTFPFTQSIFFAAVVCQLQHSITNNIWDGTNKNNENWGPVTIQPKAPSKGTFKFIFKGLTNLSKIKQWYQNKCDRWPPHSEQNFSDAKFDNS